MARALRAAFMVKASTGEVMTRPVTYRIVGCPDGRFAVMAVMASGSLYHRGGLLTLSEAETCVETLRVLMATCGAPLLRGEGDVLGADQACSK